MKNFQKVNFEYLGQALSDCSKPYRLLLFDILSQVKFKNNGFVEVGKKLIIECLKSENRNIIFGFRPAMVKCKIWVKVKEDVFMINPLVMNSSGSDQLIQLVAVYRGYGGRLIDLKNLNGSEKNNAKLIEMEYQTAMDAANGKALREKDLEMDKALKMLDGIILDQRETINEQRQSIFNFSEAFKNLTHEEIEALPPKLKVVARNGELV